jgi:hypothetical protein
MSEKWRKAVLHIDENRVNQEFGIASGTISQQPSILTAGFKDLIVEMKS